MEALSVRDYRRNLAEAFNRAENGEKVLIRRKNRIYALVNLGNENLVITPDMQRRIDDAREEFKSGKTRHFKDASSMQNWLDEL